MTLEHSLIKWHLPLFLALLTLLKASMRTCTDTVIGTSKDGGKTIRGASARYYGEGEGCPEPFKGLEGEGLCSGSRWGRVKD